uniref:hypothetical protein n=1 Tax=Vibrio cholerae TaxID=666 RepID=UPI001C1058C6
LLICLIFNVYFIGWVWGLNLSRSIRLLECAPCIILNGLILSANSEHRHPSGVLFILMPNNPIQPSSLVP